MLWPLSYVCICYGFSSLVDVKPGIANGMASVLKVTYLDLRSGVLNRTSCNICGRWYLPIFLLRNELLTLMYIGSSMVLVRSWSSLPAILKLSTVVVLLLVSEWSHIGEGTLRCSLNLSPNVLEDSPIYSSAHFNLSYLNLYSIPLFLVTGSLPLGAMSRL